jgi:hypothetical protein
MSNVDYTSRKRRPGRNRKRRLDRVDYAAGYLAILYVRSPSALLEDSIFSPPLLPNRLTNPADRVRLPAGSLHDLSQRRTLGALHHRGHLGLLVGAVPFSV